MDGRTFKEYGPAACVAALSLAFFGWLALGAALAPETPANGPEEAAAAVCAYSASVVSGPWEELCGEVSDLAREAADPLTAPKKHIQ